MDITMALTGLILLGVANLLVAFMAMSAAEASTAELQRLNDWLEEGDDDGPA